MPSVQQHYDAHLGPIYSWMLGGMDAALANARAELRELGVASLAPGVAIDLGAGPGVHAIPLAELGFAVIAIDSCAPLLDEVKRRAPAADIRLVVDDLSAFRSHHAGRANVILCMTDTLTHLPTRQAVDDLCEDVVETLAPGGIFIATFRDYSGTPPEGGARFIPVRSDENRILTCFLEYGDAYVMVHDLVHERHGNAWKLAVSAYPKLRLAPSAVQMKLQAFGLTTTITPGPRGMIRLIARAP